MNPSTFSPRPIIAALACSIAALVTVPASAQTTATTDPVGFITLTVAGTGGAVSNQLSFAGLGLTRPVEYQGSAETVAASALTDNDATWTDNQFNGPAGEYFVEITSGTGAGTTYDIATTTAATKTITLVQSLAGGVANGATFKIRKHWTIGSIFGPANESGLAPGTLSTADQILVYNGSSYDTYYYSAGGLIGTGWRKIGSAPANQSQTNTKVYPEDGLIMNRKQSAALPVVLMGAVKTGQTSVAVLNGLNFVSNVYAANQTLASSGLQASGLFAGTASTADKVQIYNGTSYDTYFISSGGLIGAGWRKVGSVPANQDQSAIAIPVGSSVILNRVAGGGFNWVIPQHPTTL